MTAASPPLHKSDPKTTILVAAGAIMGMVMGCAWGFVAEVLDTKIRTAAQLRTATGTVCLGMLPHMRKIGRRSRQSTGPTDPRIRSIRTSDVLLRQVIEAPRSACAETFRAIGVRLAREQYRGREPKVIGCIATSRGEGTSTTAANLAFSLAARGYTTLLLDWDPGRRSLSTALTPRGEPGFHDVLDESVTFDQIVWPDPQSGLHFLPAGVGGATPSRAQRTMRMHDALRKLRETYDYVIVDLPALTPVVDAHAALHLIDAFVLIVAWGRTPREKLVETLLHADLEESRWIGAVLNDVPVKLARRYMGSASRDRELVTA